MNPALRTSAAHVFVSDVEAPSLTGDDAHHLFRVLRLRDGEAVTVSDGRGRWRPTVVADRELVVAGDAIAEPSPPSLTIATAIPKGDRVEWMVQKLAELGVTEIVFVDCARSVVNWTGERAERQLARLTKVAREASAQSRRVWLPVVRGPIALAEAAALPGAVMADPDGEPARDASTVLVGPEGGFTDEERRLCRRLVSLGPQILRVETAAICAASVIAASGR